MALGRLAHIRFVIDVIAIHDASTRGVLRSNRAMLISLVFELPATGNEQQSEHHENMVYTRPRDHVAARNVALSTRACDVITRQ